MVVLQAPKQNTASVRQVNYIKDLVLDRDLSTLSERQVQFLFDVACGRVVPEPGLASRTITALKNLPWRETRRTVKPPAPRREPVGDGFYKLGDQYVKVQMNLAGSRLYTKVWDGSHWTREGASGVYGQLTPAMKLTAEQASQFGHLYGQCIFRGCKLTHETSIRLGYGPICAEKHGMPWG